MSAVDDLLARNAKYAEGFAGSPGGQPAQRLAIVTCMDARIDNYAAFGLGLGDAHVIRNAGGVVTDDVIRSLAVSQRLLGTREIAVIHHSRCGMLSFTDEEFRASIFAEVGSEPPWDAGAFADLDEDVRRSVRQITASPYLPATDAVRGFVFDVDSGRLREVDLP